MGYKNEKVKNEKVEKVGDLRPSPYNPRRITDEQKKRLKKAIEEFGDLSGIVFNRRTGRLVGGHQRIKVIPQNAIIEKTELPIASRTGTVAYGYIIIDNEKYSYREVDWDEGKEKAANIAANAHGGDWDEDKLGEILKELSADKSFDIELTGFDLGDIYNMFGTNVLMEQPDRLIELSNQLRSIQSIHEEIRKKIYTREDTDFYLVVVFRSAKESKEFLERLNLPDARYVDGRLLFKLIAQKNY